MEDRFIKQRIPKQIIDALGGVDKITKYPIIDYKNKFCTIDYIDKIFIDDVSSNISFGLDNCNRVFIVVKYVINGLSVIETLFQRFSNDHSTWAVGSSYYGVLKSSGYFINRGIEDNRIINNLKTIVNNNFIYINN